MTKEEFIEFIGNKAKNDYQKTGILASITTAQACLESGYGTSELAKNANNLFGMKVNLSGNTWKTSWDGISKYKQTTNEEYKVGVINSIVAEFRKYPSIDKSIEDHSLYLSQAKNGNKLRYQGLTKEKDYRRAAQIIKNGGYATSSTYVSALCSLIEKLNLTRFDIQKENTNMNFTNSKLVNYVKISPNKNSPRKDTIKKITIHHMAGNLSVETCGNVFAPTSRQASSNYGIDSKGRVGMYVEERDRAWTSSNANNDHQAITIEVANDGGAPDWHVSDIALAKLIDLCVDICQRNNIKKLNFTGDKTGNLTMHKWFAATGCPGPYLESKFPYIAEQVNKRLGVNTNIPNINTPVKPATPNNKVSVGSTVKLASDATYYNGKNIPQWVKNKEWIVKEVSGDRVVINKSVDGQNSINSAVNSKYLTTTSSTESTKFNPYLVKVTANALNIRTGPGINYSLSGCIKDQGTYTIIEEKNGWGLLKSKAGWINLSYTKRA